jgi:hypothetical protein
MKHVNKHVAAYGSRQDAVDGAAPRTRIAAAWVAISSNISRVAGIGELSMADLAFILVALAFFALCVGYVRFCDRIITNGESAGAVDEVSREMVGQP